MSLEVLIQAARYVDHDAKCKNHGEGSVSKQISITGNNFDLESHKQDHTLPDSVSEDFSKISSDVFTRNPSPSRSEEGNTNSFMESDTKSESSRAAADTFKLKKRKSREKEKNKRGSCFKQNTENRSVHNVLEKNRRAHLKDCFEALKQEVMETDDDKKASHLAVLKNAVQCIQQLQRQTEQIQRENERALKDRNTAQQKLLDIKREVALHNPTFDISAFLHAEDDDADSQATCTAPGSPVTADEGLQVENWKQLAVSLEAQETSSPTMTSNHSSGSSGSSSINKYSSVVRERKKQEEEKDETAVTPRRPPTKSVMEILQETKIAPVQNDKPIIKSRTPADSDAKRSLPIKLRILQDQQEGLFTDQSQKTLTSPISPAPSMDEESQFERRSECREMLKVSTYPEMTVPVMDGRFHWPENYAAFPFYSRSGFPVPVFPVNQFFLPVSAATNATGQMSQVFMMPAVTANVLAGDLYPRTQEQRPSTPC